MCACLGAIHDHTASQESTEVEQVTKLTYEELYNQTVGAPGTGKDLPLESLDDSHVYARLRQFEVLNTITEVDHSEKWVRVLEQQRFLTFSLDLMKAAKASTNFARNLDPARNSTIDDGHDMIIKTWRELLDLCYTHDVAGPAIEAVTGNLIFLLEEWSIDALKHQINVVQEIIPPITYLLSATHEVNGREIPKFWAQVYFVKRRLADRPGVKPWVSQAWKTAFDEMSRKLIPPSNFLEPKICGNVGCVEVKPAEMLCSGCKRQTYCSATCQKKDWKVHKIKCKAKNGK
ncbi:hypothetical protein DL93DRAFT_2085249 [Clavulina sp. PMI_390]|nr:hypothetical protein DL93DRAFT_2085249 [Clavulina sp. PMI_390]